jgi:hypothetical protein
MPTFQDQGPPQVSDIVGWNYPLDSASQCARSLLINSVWGVWIRMRHAWHRGGCKLMLKSGARPTVCTLHVTTNYTELTFPRNLSD